MEKFEVFSCSNLALMCANYTIYVEKGLQNAANVRNIHLHPCTEMKELQSIIAMKTLLFEHNSRL